MNKALIAISILALLALAGCSGKYDKAAKCMTDKGVTFYGAFWCPHCAREKQMIGSSMQYINYVECSLPDRSGQTQICIDANITSYPTWEFPDGSRLSGEIEPEKLIEKAECAL